MKIRNLFRRRQTTATIPHGTITRYLNDGCRCEECESAMTPSGTMAVDEGNLVWSTRPDRDYQEPDDVVRIQTADGKTSAFGISL